MRTNPTRKIEEYRLREGPLASLPEYGANGFFQIPFNEVVLAVMASDGGDWSEADLGPQRWEHVSVSLRGRCPTWEEMDFVKKIFWRDEETVLQFHVPRKQHVNYHPYCLHLWKPVGVEILLPPGICVGPGGK